MSGVRDITDGTFDAEVIDAGGVVLVEFWAPTCGPCRMVAPVLVELAVDYADRVQIVKLNTDEQPLTRDRFAVLTIPALLVFVDGELVRDIRGARPKQIIAGELDAVLAGSPRATLGG